MPLAGTRRRTPNLATAEEIAAEYRNGPLRVPKAQAAQALHAAADALRLPNRARLLIRVLLDASPAADWTRPGGLIGVWPSIETLKRKTGLSQAALGRAQADLREAGLVAFRDSGNYKRWGTRDDSGALLEFRGFDLSPIAARHGELVELAAVAALERRRWSTARAIVTERRRAIRAAITEAGETALPGPWDEIQGRYDALEDRFGRVLRNPGTTPIDDVELLEECAAALAGLDADVCRLLSAPAASVCETAGDSAPSDQAEVSTTPLDFEPHIESTTNEPPGPLYEIRRAADAAQHPREAASGRQSALRREPGRGVRPVKNRERPPRSGRRLRFVCRSRWFSAPSPFWSTMAHRSPVGANWSGSHTSGFPNGPAAAPSSGGRAKRSLARTAPRSPLASRCRSTPWAIPTGPGRISRGSSKRRAPAGAAISTPPCAALPNGFTHRLTSETARSRAAAAIHPCRRLTRSRIRPSGTARLGGPAHETGLEADCP